MLDFVRMATKRPKKDVVEVYPKFVVKSDCKDLMIRGRDFYAVYDELTGLWSNSESCVSRQIDSELQRYADQFKNEDQVVQVKYMWDGDSGSIDRWHKYCQKQMRDNWHDLDKKIIFSNVETKREDYASKKLPYALYDGDISCYNELMEVLYDPEERAKLEWSIGAIFTGDAKRIQKFIVLYGEAGSGKSTFLNLIQALFEGYYSVFDAKELASSNNSFALESFKNGPLVSIQHDGDLSRIEDNTKLNSIVSHETMEVNEKFKSKYVQRFDTFLYMGTNRPVRITEAKSGLLRRLIDVSPSGRKLNYERYTQLVNGISYELGAIASYCIKRYQDMGESYYDKYVPTRMISATNDFYDFVEDNYDDFKSADFVTLSEAWRRYREYCDFAKVTYPYTMRVVRTELKNYFRDYKSQTIIAGKHLRNVYSRFITSKFEFDEDKDIFEPVPVEHEKKPEEVLEIPEWLEMNSKRSIFDEIGNGYLAQYARITNNSDRPRLEWKDVTTHLGDLDTGRLHYVKVPENMVVIDFDIRDEKGEKNYQKNLAAASKWPPTYAELSKSGGGIHLHYFYEGDIDKLSHSYSDNIEVKTFKGGSSLRRKLTKCNDISIQTIGSGLPLKGGKVSVNWDGLRNEKTLRTMIENNLNKKYHAFTKPSICFIKKLLDDAYEEGFVYDVSDLASDIQMFASNSSNQAGACLELVSQMRFKSVEKDKSISIVGFAKYKDGRLVFFDIEVFPNLIVVVWKYHKSPNCTVLINPSSYDIEELVGFKLVGFNNRDYDNHILWAIMCGATIQQVYDLSQRIIVLKDKNAKNKNAYDISYTDVFDFLAASKKKSLKKFEIELQRNGMDILHKENEWPWTEPVPEERWSEIAAYCENDVRATEAVFEANRGDYDARLVLVFLANVFAPGSNSTPNDTTNTLTARIIFGNNMTPQSEFVYTDLSEDPKFHGYIPCHKSPDKKSHYRNELPGEGGYVYAEPGAYTNVVVLDIRSMHPNNARILNIFGDRYTKQFSKLIDLRAAIKHKDIEEAKAVFGLPELDEYLNDLDMYPAISDALKTAINSVYGQTKTAYKNRFRDERNKDNIIAKRGALFMINLKYAVQEKGYQVVHIKTDSIKIPNPDKDILQFIYDFGQSYGLEFEIEEEYEKFCLVNNAVYIAKEVTPHWGISKDGKVYWNEDREEDPGKWTATGAQFQHPYIFKTLFTHEPIEFYDKCETISVTSRDALYLDFNEDLPDVSEPETVKDIRRKLSAQKEAPTIVDPVTGSSTSAKPARLTKRQTELADRYLETSDEELDILISKGHDYKFVGKIGLFCPMEDGCGGGWLVAHDRNAGYSAPGGTKGFRFMESEYVKSHDLFDKISHRYYQNLIDKAVDAISEYCDFEWFASDDPVGYSEVVPEKTLEDYMNKPETSSDDITEVPFE